MTGSDLPLSRSKGRVWLFLAALLLAEMTSAFEVAMIYAAMPRFMEVFGDPAKVGWVLTGCLMVAAVSAALCSRLGDLYGRRVEVEFVARLRDEEKFPDLPTLVAQMHRDADEARRILQQHTPGRATA